MRRTQSIALVLSAAAVSVFAALPAPAHAEPVPTDFLGALDSAGLAGIDPATAMSVGQSVCPMLSEPGQQLADVAANVSDAIGRPLGPATMFTGLAITMFCPRAVTALTDGKPFSFFG